MTTDLTLPENKKSNWLKTAERSHALDISLQSKSSAIIVALSTLPTLITAEAISGYEANLKKTKQDISDLCAERMEFTSILDTVKASKMKFEKEAAAALPPFETALLKCKQEKKKIDDLAQAKVNEIAALRLSFANHITQQRALMESSIVTQVAKMFEVAITTKTQPERIETYLALNMNTLTEADFKPAKYNGGAPIYITKEESAIIMQDIWSANIISPIAMVEEYQSQLKAKFEFYSISLKQSEAALALSASESAAAIAAINDDSLNQQVADKLQTVSAPLTTSIEVKTKSIKKVWRLDMIDSEQTAITILSAFVANWALCKPHLRLKDAALMNLSIKQMGGALVSVKEADEAFSVSGIVFKVEEKL